MDPNAHAAFHRYTSPSIAHLSFDSATQSHIPFRASTTHTHRTWAKTHSCRPELYIQPHTLPELRLILLLATTQKKKIVTVGSGHSPSDLTCTPSWMINLDHFSSLISADLGKMRMTVQAGMRLYNLLEELDARGWAMPTLGSITEQSIAGAIATSTHGSSMQHGLLSASVTELKLLLASGDVVACSASHNTELFRAALVSLGALGIVVEVTIQAIPAYNVHWRQHAAPLSTMLTTWSRGLWTDHEFIRCWWFPYTEKAIIWSGDKTHLARRPPPKSWYGARLGRFTYELLLYIARWIPTFTPHVERFVFWMQYGKTGEAEGVERSVEALTMDCLFPQLVNEWSLPLSSGPEAISRLQTWLTTPSGPNIAGIPIPRGNIHVHAPIEVRCANTLRHSPRPFLDQSCHNEPTLYLNATLYRPFLTDLKEWRTWFRAFEYVMREYGGKPHWAKNHVSVGKEEMWEMYPEMERWVKIRNEVDPGRVFVNEWLEREVLGREGEEEEGIEGSGILVEKVEGV